MNAIEVLLQQPAAQAIGWALLQFVWQGALVGLLSAAALFVLRRSAADVRYVVATIGLTLMLTMPAVTAVQTWRAMTDTPLAAAQTSVGATSDAASASAAERRAVASAPVSAPVSSAEIQPVANASPRAIDGAPIAGMPWVRLALLIWVSGVAVLTLRLLCGWFFVQRLRSRGVALARADWLSIAARLSKQLHIARPIRLLESAVVEVPTVIGWLRPVVLMPASAMSGMGLQQFEAILAHELAHIRRHDYLVNLLQTLVETLLFYHPAVWWLSRRIRVERENCCDDLAVRLCGDPYTYARALADLEELRGNPGRLVLAATGGSLLHRVRRLIATPSHAGRGPGWLAGSTAILLIAGIAAGAVGRIAPEEEAVETATAVIPATVSAPTPVVAASTPASAPSGEARRSNPTGASSTTESRATSAPASPVVQYGVGEAVAAFVVDILEQLVWGPRVAPPAPPPPVPPVPAASPVPPAPMSPSAFFGSFPPSPSEAPAAPVVPSTPLAPPEPPAAWAPEVAPLPPAPPTPPSPPSPRFGGSGQSRGNMTWSDGKQKIEVRYEGAVEFSDDDSDVKSLSPGGELRIREGGLMSSRTVEFTADGSGTIRRRYWEGSSEKPFEPNGRAWLAQMLPKIIRQTGFGAPARVARILNAKGPGGVLAEISLVEGSWAKRVYFTELLKSPGLDAATVRQALEQAGRQIESDFELASLLIASDGLLTDDTTRRAFFTAATSIQSDFEMRRVFSSALKRGRVSPDIMAAVLEASTAIESDFEEAELLVQVARLQPLDARTRAPFLKALATVDSDFECRRVVSAVVRADPTPETLSVMLDPSIAIDSDFEQAEFLLDLVKAQAIDGPLRAPFFKGLDTIGSSFERGRVLQAVVRRGNMSAETMTAVLRSTQSMDSGHEASQILLAVASTHQITGEARDLYITAAERLGDFEQGRVLTALVKAERRQF